MSKPLELKSRWPSMRVLVRLPRTLFMRWTERFGGERAKRGQQDNLDKAVQKMMEEMMENEKGN